MHTVQIKPPASLDNLKSVELPAPIRPGHGEILVRLKASSLNLGRDRAQSD